MQIIIVLNLQWFPQARLFYSLPTWEHFTSKYSCMQLTLVDVKLWIEKEIIKKMTILIY